MERRFDARPTAGARHGALPGSAIVARVRQPGTPQQEADDVSRFLSRLPPGGLHEPRQHDPDDPPIGSPQFGGPGSGTITLVVDAAGHFAGGNPADSTDLPVSDGVQAALAGSSDVRLATVDGDPVRVLSEPVDVQGERLAIQVIVNRTDEQRTLTILLLVLVIGSLAVLCLAGLVGFVYAGNALVPIRESLRRQREFAADASHELRTPLTIVRGNVERLRKGPDAEALRDIEAEVDHLASLVEDLLLLARSDSGAVELRRDPVDLADAAGEAVQRLRGLAAAREVRLSLDAAPATVTGDADRLRQLVAVLVDNAIRHTPAGGSVRITVAGEDGPTIRVDDQGRGIQPQDLPHLFDRFWRAADAPSGGTGLGLAIAAWIAQHHGGAIEARNRAEGGARFEVHLPPA